MNLKDFTLSAGKHASPKHGTCVMELYSIMIGAQFTDTLPCISNGLQSYLRCFNDNLPNDYRQRLIDYLPRVDGLKNDVKEQELAFLCADYAVRVFAPIALKSAGLNNEADKLITLNPIIDKKSAAAAANYAAANYAANYANYAAAAAAANYANYAAANYANYAANYANYAAANYAAAAANYAAYAAAAANAAANAYELGFELLDKMIAILEDGLTTERFLIPCESECNLLLTKVFAL